MDEVIRIFTTVFFPHNVQNNHGLRGAIQSKLAYPPVIFIEI
jgi:hypothetical protein